MQNNKVTFCKELSVYCHLMEIIISSAGESGEITTTHLLLGIWSEKESAGYKILESLGFDDEKAKELSKSVSF